MAGIFRNLIAPLASAAGDTILGAKQDRDEAVARAVAQRAAQRQSVLDALALRKGQADITKTLAEAGKMERPQASDFDILPSTAGYARVPKAGEPGIIKGPDDKPLMRPEPPASFSFPVGADAEGNPVVLRGNNRTGEIAPTQIAGKPSSAKPTEQQEKSFLFYNLMKNAEPEIQSAIKSGQVRPAAISAYLQADRIGFGLDDLARSQLNAEEQTLLRAGRDFVAGVNRKETGATITPNEMKETLGRYFPGLFGDAPELGEAKNRARAEYIESMRMMAGPAMDFYGKRQSQQPTREQALWDAAVAKHGEAVVLEKFGPRP